MSSYEDKQQQLKEIFANCPDQAAKYQKLIELGKVLPQMDSVHKVAKNLVPGCQSLMYLYSKLENGKVFFTVSSDALISAGLAAVLVRVYDGETPETILTCPPNFLDELHIGASLTPGRANGLHNIHLRMQKDALNFLVSNQE